MGMKKVLALLMSIIMVMSLLAGCGSSAPEDKAEAPADNGVEAPAAPAEDALDTSEFVELKMYLVGDKPEGYDDIVAAANEILKEKVNATISVDWLSWAEHGTKYSLLFSGGEEFDMIYTASSWCHFEQTVGLGGFVALDEAMIQTYCPDVWATLPQVAWDQATINGSIYMIPANFIEVTPDVVAIRGDLMAQFGYDDITSYDELISFYKDCAANGVYGNAVGAGSLYYLWHQSEGYRVTSGAPDNGQLVLFHATDAGDVELRYIAEDDGFVEYCRQMKALADANCWPSDVLSATSDRQDGLLSGRGASMVWNAGTCLTYANQANAEHPDWNINIYNIMPDIKYTATKYNNGGMGFNVMGKNLERSLMVYNLLATDQELQDLFQLGIKGTHWNDAGEGQYEVVEGNAYNPSNIWAWRNLNIMKKQYQSNPTAADTKVNELNEFFLNNVKDPHPLDNFSFDPTNVSTQFAAVEAVTTTYFDPLVNGLVDDVDKWIADFRAALDAAGVQDLLNEMQSQVDAFLAAQ